MKAFDVLPQTENYINITPAGIDLKIKKKLSLSTGTDLRGGQGVVGVN